MQFAEINLERGRLCAAAFLLKIGLAVNRVRLVLFFDQVRLEHLNDIFLADRGIGCALYAALFQ